MTPKKKIIKRSLIIMLFIVLLIIIIALSTYNSNINIIERIELAKKSNAKLESNRNNILYFV